MQNPANRLNEISVKESRIVLGLMSGTSLDGLDLALCKISGLGFHSNVKLLEFETIPYHNNFVNQIKEIFSKEIISLNLLTLLHRDIGILHAQMINSFFTAKGIQAKQVDLIASHGQTIYHIPSKPGSPAATLQIGDADEIATHTQIITVSDFRQKSIAAGGEGAPLAPYGDLLLFSSKEKSRILINIGGIANLSYITAGQGKILYSDTGPGNTLINQIMQLKFGKPFDDAGETAKKGKCVPELITAMMADGFFEKPIPKSTGPELFNIRWLENILLKTGIQISDTNLVHSITKFTAITIAKAVNDLINNQADTEIYISGGGVHNLFLVQLLQQELPGLPIKTTSYAGIDADAKEAILFALLANECVAGDPVIFDGTGLLPVRMGKISFPD